MTSVALGADTNCLVSGGLARCVGANDLGPLGSGSGPDAMAHPSPSLVVGVP